MEPKGKPRLADVDGTVPGKVQLMAIKLVEGFDEDPKQMHTYFEEGEHEHHPWRMAEGLKLSLEGDWPDHHWAIVGNWRARYLRWRDSMLAMGISFTDAEVSPQEYLDTFEK